MNIAEARAFSNGIEFYVKKKTKNYTIKASRNENGNITILKTNEVGIPELKKENPLFTLSIAIVFAFSEFFLKKYFNHPSLNIFLTYALIITVIFLDYLRKYFDSSQYSSHQYHAAEHKVLNYVDKYKKAPETIEQAMKMSSISYRCGSTLINFVLLYSFLFVFTFWVIPFPTIENLFFSLLVKGFVCILLLLPCFWCWIKGYCNFLQRFVLKEPTLEQVEVALVGMQVYWSEKNRDENFHLT